MAFAFAFAFAVIDDDKVQIKSNQINQLIN